MTPNIIADSDGDDSETDSPVRVCQDAELVDFSSPGPDDQSASTDPSFFNTIFKEQQAAAMEESANQGAIKMTGDSEATEFVSFDRGFERAKNAEAHDEKSPWNVPSSPEAAKPKQSTRKTLETSTRTKITRGLRRQLDDIGYISPDDEPPTTQKSKKRRRIHTETGSHFHSDGLVSTLPIESDVSLHVAPKTLTNSQREQYSTVNLAVSSSPTQSLKQCSINVGSSGSATNINTPRSNLPSSVKPPSAEKPVTSTSVKSNMIDEIEASPIRPSAVVKLDDEYQPEEEGDDVASQSENTESVPTNTKKPRGRPKKVVDATSTKEKDTATVKAKKKRGRPKKSEMVVSEEGNKVDEEDLAPTRAESVSRKANAQEATDLDEVVTVTPQAPKVAEANLKDTSKQQQQDTPTVDVKNPVSPTKNDMATKKEVPTPGSASRQLYRVGLSKKTKIAPLLKVIRK